MMNVCTFVGKIRSVTPREYTNKDYCHVDIDVPEYYTNSKGERKVEWTDLVCYVYSTAADYIETNAKNGDDIAFRATYKFDNGLSHSHYFRINEFKIL